MTPTEIADIVTRLRDSADLHDAWDAFELGQEVPAPLSQGVTAKLEREAAARIAEPESQIRRDDEIDAIRQDVLDADQKRIAELEQQVAFVRMVTVEIESVTRLTAKSDHTHCIMALDSIGTKASAVLASLRMGAG